MFASHKNSYLQLPLIVNPRIVNRSIRAARDDALCCDEHDLEPPFNRLVSEQPPTPACYDHEWLKSYSYGRGTYAQMAKMLDNDRDILSLMSTLNMLSSMVRDPEKTALAVRYDIVDKLAELLYNMNKSVQLKAFKVLTTMANYGFCKELIVKNHLIMDEIEACVVDNDVQYNLRALEMLRVLGTRFDVIDRLLEMGFLKFLLMRIPRDQDIVILAKLEVIKLFMYCSGKCISFGLEAFENFLYLLEDRRDVRIVVGTLECLMQLMSTKTGRQLALKYSLMPTIIELLHREDPDVHRAATGVLMNFTIKLKVKALIYHKHQKIIKRLVELSLHNDATLQIYAMQTMANLADFIKLAKILQQFTKKLQQIPVGDNVNLQKFKSKLTQQLDATINL